VPGTAGFGASRLLPRVPTKVRLPSRLATLNLEEIPDVHAKFGGDLWKAVEWAQIEQRRDRFKDLDLNARLQAPPEAHPARSFLRLVPAVLLGWSMLAQDRIIQHETQL
jgi:hypothetical protein